METVIQWFARIKNEAIHCKFGDQLDDKIKEKFVTGLRKGHVLDKVCEVDHSETLANIVEIAIKKEATLTSRTSLADVHDLRATKVGTKKGFINKKQNQGDSTTTSQNFKDEPKCAHCGGTHHNFAKCKFKGYRCNKCQKVGHLARVCNMESTNCVYPEEVDETEFELSDMYMFGSDKVTELVEMIVEGRPLQIEIDSGSR